MKYTVLTAKYKGSTVPFVIDTKFVNNIMSLKKTWHYGRNNIYAKFDNKNIPIHYILMNNVDARHVNKIGLDNRLCNLCVHNNKNMKKKKRTVKLPRNCGINKDDIPTYVWYVKENGNHGDRFIVNVKDQVKWKTTSSKKVSLKYKLEEAKKYMRRLKREQTELFEENSMNGEYTKQGKKLLLEFFYILKKANYDIVNMPQIKGITKKYLQMDIKNLNINEKKLLLQNKKYDFGDKRRRLISNLPENCEITINDLPKYSYYRPPYKHRGDYFVVENHPKQEKKYWQTTSSKNISIKEKYDDLLTYLKKLNN